MFRQINWPEILIIGLVLILLFGAKRLPEIGRSMGRGLKEFKSATKGLADDVKAGMDDDDEVPAKPSTTEVHAKPAKRKVSGA
jgi:sec-independent protein translocase protein TatA